MEKLLDKFLDLCIVGFLLCAMATCGALAAYFGFRSYTEYVYGSQACKCGPVCPCVKGGCDQCK